MKLEVVRADVPMTNLPKSLDGLKIGVMADFHAGAFATRSTILQAVSIINAKKPDLVVLLGDYMDTLLKRTYESLEKKTYIFRILKRLRPPLGIYAVLGNHDHYIDAAYVKEKLSDVPAVVLHNQSITLDNGLLLAGVDDLLRGSADPLKATEHLSPESTTILLSHNPDISFQLKRNKCVKLVLCGHTHGGQIRVPFLNWAIYAPCSRHYRRRTGLIRETVHRWTFLTKGIGTSIVPIRVACPPDVGLLRLTRG